jgi:hypothetical protein
MLKGNKQLNMVGSNKQKGPEKIAPQVSAEKSEDKERSIEESDITSEAGVDTGDILEGLDDGGEMVDSIKLSEKSEGVGEHRKATGKKFGDFKKKMTKKEAEALKKKLMRELPPPRAMIREIRAHVHHEIKMLEKQAAKAERAGKFKELADSVSRMRELRVMLYDLLHATAEMVKNLWLKVVHGIV